MSTKVMRTDDGRRIRTGHTLRIGRIHIHIRPGAAILWLLLLGLALFSLLPLVYVICTAFKPMEELFLYPPRFFVQNPTGRNFRDLVVALGNSEVPFLRYVFNSLLVSVVNVVASVMVSAMAAYALTKFRLPGGNFVFNLIIASLMFSGYVTQIPSFLVVNNMGLVNTYLALILPKIASSYNMFLVKQFAEQLPDPLLEAAKIDGANQWQTFTKIVIPFLKPCLATVVVFAFVANWNDYFSALVFITDEQLKTLPLMLSTISAGASLARAGATAAATMLMTLPTVVIYLFMQKQVISTMAHSGIKA